MSELTDRLISGPAKDWTGPKRLCATCRHHRRHPLAAGTMVSAECWRRQFNPVSGNEIMPVGHCEYERSEYGKCGPDGTYWRPIIVVHVEVPTPPESPEPSFAAKPPRFPRLTHMRICLKGMVQILRLMVRGV